MLQKLIENIIQNLQTAEKSGQGDAFWVDCPEQTVEKNEFVVFLKPEVTSLAAGVNVASVLNILSQALEKFDVRVHAVRVLNGQYLAEKKIIDSHYGVISRIAREGLSALAPEAQAKALDLAGGDSSIITGSYTFMGARPTVTADALNILCDNIGVQKIGPGSYALPLKADGKSMVVLSPFYPFQAEHFISSGKTIVCFRCSSARSWKELRTYLVGSTNPTKAEIGSVRNQFLQNKDLLGLAEVSTGKNGMHLSAGPLEGMVECMRFFTQRDGSALKYADTAFGALLKQSGYSDTDIVALAKNPNLEIAPELREEVGGKAVISAFDATEEINANEAVVLFDKVLPMQAGA